MCTILAIVEHAFWKELALPNIITETAIETITMATTVIGIQTIDELVGSGNTGIGQCVCPV